MRAQVTRKKRDQDDIVANLGNCPDTPGTELAAYFDRFSIDDPASLEGALGVLWIAPAIEIPFKLWMHVNEVQVETDLFWETMGKLTAIRQWLRMLEDLTRRHEADFPEHPVIDVAHYISGEPYYLGATTRSCSTPTFPTTSRSSIRWKRCKKASTPAPTL